MITRRRMRWIALIGLTLLIAAVLVPGRYGADLAVEREPESHSNSDETGPDHPAAAGTNSDRFPAPPSGTEIRPWSQAPPGPVTEHSPQGSPRDRDEFSNFTFDLPHPQTGIGFNGQYLPPVTLGASADSQVRYPGDTSASGTVLNPTSPSWVPIPPPAPPRLQHRTGSPWQRHLIAPGETLQSISTKYFGHPGQYLAIYELNPDVISNPLQLPVGQEIRIPVGDDH